MNQEIQLYKDGIHDDTDALQLLLVSARWRYYICGFLPFRKGNI